MIYTCNSFDGVYLGGCAVVEANNRAASSGELAKYGSIGDFLLAVPQEKKETEG